MEEAYHELYQQFLHLRSLCLKQAALLHQLTAALQKRPGASALNGEVSDLISVPAEVLSSLSETPQPLRAGLLVPAETCRVEESSRKAGTLSAVLAEDMSQLSVDVPCRRMQEEKTGKAGSFMQTSDSSGHLGASFGKVRFEQNGPAEDGAQNTSRTPVSDCASQVGDLVHQAGALMSDVVLHSHVCEFCQAVFPGDSTTKGEFLRHLCTHVT